MERAGAVHGLGGWFDCDLSDSARMTNSPLAVAPIQRAQVFLPIGEPVQVKQGETARVSAMVRPADGLVRWTVGFAESGWQCSHSTWQGMLLSPEDLHRLNLGRVPKPNRKGLARGIVLGYCDGKRSASEIEQAIARDHPVLFPSPTEVSRFVARVLAKDTE